MSRRDGTRRNPVCTPLRSMQMTRFSMFCVAQAMLMVNTVLMIMIIIFLCRATPFRASRPHYRHRAYRLMMGGCSMPKINIAPIVDALQLVLSKDPLSTAATKLLLTIQQLQRQASGSRYLPESAVRAHAIEKRLLVALNMPRNIDWTGDERAVIST